MKLKNLSFLFIAFALLILNSCKKDTVDVTHLLSSIPSSSAGVVVFNLESLLEDTGCKIKDNVVKPSPQVQALIDKASDQDKEGFTMLFNGESGIDPKGAVLFYDASRVFLTFGLYDENKFYSFIENNAEGKFSDEGSGVMVLGNVAAKNAQGWVCLSSHKKIDPDAILNYSSLKDSQSFLVTDAGEKLLTEENDIRGWALINTFASEMLGRADKSMFTLGLGFLFQDAEAVSFKADFKKGELEAEMMVLNDKGKPAKYLLPSDKIDVNTLKSLGGTCDGLMAFTVNSKLVKKFQQISSTFGGALLGDLGESLKNVDGTVGFASGKNSMETVKGVVTVKGEVNPSLRDLVSRLLGPVSQDGKYLYFSKGEVSGNIDVADAAEELKGACLGLVVDASGLNSVGYGNDAPKGFRNLVLKFNPESGGLELELEVKTTDPSENALLTLIKN